MMGEVRLLDGAALQQGVVTEGEEGGGQEAHHRAIAGVAVVVRSFEVPLEHVVANPLAAGAADIDRIAPHPGDEPVGDRRQIPSTLCRQRPRHAQRHFGVVGDPAGFEPQPAAADDLAMDLEPGADLGWGHEFGGGAEGVAERHAEKGGAGTGGHSDQVGVSRRSGLPLRIRRRSPAPPLPP